MATDNILNATSPAQERLPEIVRLLRELHPDAKCALDFENPLQLLVATILSAQCTDERVNKVTPVLFARYPNARALAEADREELEQIVHSTGFYRNKAKNIQEACRRIVTEYGGEVPSNMADLLSLAGVARKTANVVLGNCYGIADGIVVPGGGRLRTRAVDLRGPGQRGVVPHLRPGPRALPGRAHDPRRCRRGAAAVPA